MATSARDIIVAAARKAGVVGKGVALSADEADQYLGELNRMLARWSTKRVLVPALTKITHTLSTGVGEYTIGPGGDINRTRPVNISEANVAYNDVQWTLHCRRNADAYVQIGYPGLDSIPAELYYFRGEGATAQIALYPRPDRAYVLTAYVLDPMTSFASLSTDSVLPAEYEDALVFNLAVRILADLDRAIPNMLEREALLSYGDLVTVNQTDTEQAIDPGIRGRSSGGFSWRDGGFGR